MFVVFQLLVDGVVARSQGLGEEDLQVVNLGAQFVFQFGQVTPQVSSLLRQRRSNELFQLGDNIFIHLFKYKREMQNIAIVGLTTVGSYCCR